MGFITEFKKFILRGSLVDLAIGFTVGAAFTTVAKSLVNDIIMPPIGLLIGRVDFKDLFVVLRKGGGELPPYATIADAQAAGAVTLNYGQFVNNVLALLVVAVVMFLIIRLVNRLDELMDSDVDGPKKPEDPDHKKCPFCRSTIAFRATRCPQCTSQLERAAPPARSSRAPA